MATHVDRRSYTASPADLAPGTLTRLFFDAVERHDSEEALRYKAGDTWRSISHREVIADVRRLTLALRAWGLDHGDKLAILSENRPEWLLSDMAALCLGGCGVPVYATLPAQQIAYILQHSGARLVFVSDAEQLEKVREVWGELPALEKAIVFDHVPSAGQRVLTLQQALELGDREAAAGKGGDFRERALAARPEDLATIIYTSGTTGRPKGVMLTHNNIYSNTRALDGILEIGPGDVALSFLPLSHIFERTVDYFYFAKGCTIAYVGSFDLIAQSFVEVKPTIAAAAPRVYEKIYGRVMSAAGLKRRIVQWARAVGDRWADARLAGREPSLATRLQYRLADRLVFAKLRERTGGRIRYFVSGSAPLNPEVAKFFYSAGLMILEGYGLTETSPVTNANTPSSYKIGTVGPPIPGTAEMIADDGEILVRGPQVMKGYYQDEEATRQTIDADGWLHTGDVGEIDADGHLRITDRKKDIIVTAGGKNIAPAPIENRVKTNKFVAEAVMLGDKRPFAILLIAPDFEQLFPWAEAQGIRSRDRAELVGDERVRHKVEAEVSAMLEGLARYERPKKIALVAREFTVEGGELTPSLKVKRRVIEERYRELIEQLYEGARVAAE